MHPTLTPRMREILPYVCCGYTNAEIAEKVYASEETVKSYVKRLLDYFEARNRTHLAALAVTQGYVDMQRATGTSPLARIIQMSSIEEAV